MTRFCVTLLWITSLVVGISTVDAQVIRSHGIVKLKGNVAYPEELSGVTFWGDFLIACPDEGAEFNVFKCVCPNYELVTKVNLLSDPDEEIDMEGAASDSEYLYIVGSHSIRRKSIDEQGTYKKNRKRLTRVEPHTESYGLYRIKLNAAGQMMAKDRVDLRKFLETDEVIGPFLAVPGKENGIDIEGVAVKNGTIYVGFRGPVLRGNFVPVLTFEFGQPDDYELKFVQLGGRGIRDLVAVEGGFLILAGAVGDGDTSCKLYLWNGEDCVPGKDRRRDNIIAIGEFSKELGANPEGVAVASETANEWRLLVVSDGSKNASKLVVPKPGAMPVDVNQSLKTRQRMRLANLRPS